MSSTELVGTILCGTDGRRGYIHHLAVVGSFRQKRVASQLVARCLNGLSECGVAKCHAFVFHDNPYADLFWRATGWEHREDLLVYSKPVPRET